MSIRFGLRTGCDSKQGNFTSLCLTAESSRNISDSDVSEDLSLESLSLKIVELENTLCNQDKLLC
jgi:hypothetical protein